MIDLTNIKDVKGLQSNLHAVFDGPAGKEAMKFLEHICGWYDFAETDPDVICNLNGRRQVLATIKTLLEHPAEQVKLVAEGA